MMAQGGYSQLPRVYNLGDLTQYMDPEPRRRHG
jgi:hypothetical protein